MANILWVGVRFNLLVAIVFVRPQAVRLTLFGDLAAGTRLGRWTSEVEWLIGFLILPFMLATEWIFFDEFNSRLDYIAFEYLVYPGEVCWNIYPTR